jgi:hypothetical protein
VRAFGERYFHITIANTANGETREFNLSKAHMTAIKRALQAYTRAPKFLATFFDPR